MKNILEESDGGVFTSELGDIVKECVIEEEKTHAEEMKTVPTGKGFNLEWITEHHR